MKMNLLLRGSLAASVAVAMAGCQQEEAEVPVYQLVPVSFRDVVVSASAAGSIEPVLTVEVKSKASGEILQVNAETGDIVRRGDLLVRVDQRVPRNALVQAEADTAVAEAQLANAESQLRRAEALYQTQSITEAEYENARLARANANAQLVRSLRSLEDARIAFEDTEVRAPANGIILERNIEVGTVIQSATSNVSGGAVLLQMANLDTVQIRALVDETDIGKITPGMDVTINVDAYANRSFRGGVLKIEPQAVEEQNVTMFPVLVRIPNRENLLRPGMNTEVEIHIGERRDVLAVPNAALRTQRDVASAAAVLGLEMEAVQQQLAAAQRTEEGGASFGGNTAADADNGNTIEFRGRTVELPDGVTREQVQPIMAKMADGPAGFQSLTSAERSLMQRIMGGGRDGGGRRGGRQSRAATDAAFGGTYIVFVKGVEGPMAKEIRTGLTDLDYSEIVSGLTEADTIMILPSASLIQQQQEFQERMNRFGGGGLPGVSNNRGR